MQIERFAVRDFRKLAGDVETGGVEIGGLEPSITVIVGDNEEGKSTLLKALQAVFFDRHKLTGQALQDMMPFAGVGLRPAVEVDFEIDGTKYRLEKAFGRNASAMLSGGNERWEGETAEERLRYLLGFSHPGRGAAKNEHRGLAGLLWVEQGRAFAPLAMNSDSQVMLREAIESEVGQVLGGERGRLLLDEVEKRAGKYYTATTREREALNGLRKRVAGLEKEGDAQERALRAYDTRVKDLERLQDAIDRFERDGSLSVAKAEAESADEALLALERIEGRLAAAEAHKGQAKTKWDAAEGDRQRRTNRVAEVDRTEREVGKAEAILSELGPEWQAAERTKMREELRFAALQDNRNKARDDWNAARRTLKRTEIAERLAAQIGQLEQAKGLSEQIALERQELAGNPVDEKVLGELREMQSESVGLEAKLDAAAAVLVFSPEGRKAVSVDGDMVDTSQPVRIVESTVFSLQDFGKLQVTPGGEDLAGLRTRLSESESRLRNELDRLGLDAPSDAEAAFLNRQALEGRINGLEGEIKGIAPDGVEALQNIVQKTRGELAAAGGDANGLDLQTAKSNESQAHAEHDEAVRATDEAMVAQNEARRHYDSVNGQWVGAKAARTEKANALTGYRKQLESERREVSDEGLDKRADKAESDFNKRQEEYKELLGERDALEPEAVRLEQKRAQEAHEMLRKKIDNTKQSAGELAAELRGQGQNGLAEELDIKRGELEVARAELMRTEADAKAWKLLLDTLRETEREAKDIFLGPVYERLLPYLRILFPGAELRLKEEDDLEIDYILREGVKEPFVSLSIGAREQVAVLTRLALADLLREKGRPVALILDDPLVNSDDPRFGRMTLALRKAAAALQIVVLTCHEARYEALGAKTIRLADCRIGG